MSALRLAASLMVLGSCALFGAVRRARSSKKLEALSGLIEDIRFASEQIRLFREGLDSIVKGLMISGRNNELWKCVDREINSANGRTAKCEEVKDRTEAEKLVLDFFRKTSSHEPETETKRFGLLLEKLESIQKAESEKEKERMKLSGSLSLLFGLAAALLIL